LITLVLCRLHGIALIQPGMSALDQKRTCAVQVPMSAKGQKRTLLEHRWILFRRDCYTPTERRDQSAPSEL